MCVVVLGGGVGGGGGGVMVVVVDPRGYEWQACGRVGVA